MDTNKDNEDKCVFLRGYGLITEEEARSIKAKDNEWLDELFADLGSEDTPEQQADNPSVAYKHIEKNCSSDAENEADASSLPEENLAFVVRMKATLAESRSDEDNERWKAIKDENNAFFGFDLEASNELQPVEKFHQANDEGLRKRVRKRVSEAKPEPAIIQPEIVQPFAGVSDHRLIKRIAEIHNDAGDDKYGESAQQDFWKINVELNQRNVLPYKRVTHPKFDRVTCKQKKTSLYMRDLQTVDLYYVWHWHNGRKTFGSYAGIFEGDVFDKALADTIASAKLRVEAKEGESGKLDADHLDLPIDIQRKLSVLRSDAARQWQDEQKKKAGKLHNRKLEFELKAHSYKKDNPKSRLTIENIPVYVNVWLAREIAGGEGAKPASVIIEYEKLTGEIRNRDYIRGRFDLINKINAHKNGVAE